MNAGKALCAVVMACGLAGVLNASPAQLSTASAPSVWDYQEPAANQMDGWVAGYLLKTLTGLAVVLGLFFLMFWVYRRFVEPRLGSPAVQPGAVQVLGHTILGPRSSIYVVRAAGRRLVLGVTQQSMVLLADAPENEQSNRRSETQSVAGFKARFREHAERIKRS